MNTKIKIIGITGGSGSGKSYLVKKLAELFSPEELEIIHEDNYYKDLKDLPLDNRAAQNFDHPDSKDLNALLQHIKMLKSGKATEIPVYDFKKHVRSDEIRTILPKPVIIIEGILLMSNPKIIEELDLSIFVDTEDDIRFIRRLKRDIAERARTVDCVVAQYLSSVKPMYEKFIKPLKDKADLIISGEWEKKEVLEDIKSRIKNLD